MMVQHIVLPRFTFDEACRAHDEWGANCGPAALACVVGMTLEQVRPHLDGFDAKRYTNPKMMFEALRSIGVRWQCAASAQSSENQGMLAWPHFGLARIQWEGPWTKPGVPIRARYRHAHWVAADARDGDNIGIFDVNCMNVGGWVPLRDWVEELVPWLLKQVSPKADGRWHITHSIEVEVPCP